MKNFMVLLAVLAISTFVSCSKLTEEELYGEYPDDTSTPTDNEISDTTDTATENPTDIADTDPTNPTDEPTNPTDEPTNPTDEPTNPTDEPTNPTDEPTNPTDEPTNPTDEPTNPTDEPTNPTDNNDSDYPENDNEPDDDSEPTDGNEPDNDTEPTDGSEPDNDTESGDDNEPDDDSEPTDGNEPDNDTESGNDNEPDDDSEPTDSSEPDNDTEPTEPACVPTDPCGDKYCGFDDCGNQCGIGDCGLNKACNEEQTKCVPYNCEQITVSQLRERQTHTSTKFMYEASYTGNTSRDFKFTIKYPAELPDTVDLSNFPKYINCSKEISMVCLYIQKSDILYFQQSGTINISSLASDGSISAPISNIRLVETGHNLATDATYEIPGGSCIEISNQSLDYFAY